MPDSDEAEIVLDLSRLLSRVLHPAPTGVDRCEMAYASGLLAMVPERLCFAAVHPAGLYGRLPNRAVRQFLRETEERWEHGAVISKPELRRRALKALINLRPRSMIRRTARARVYLQASPNNLTNQRLVGGILQREQARFVCLLHDLIPLQYPEYARPDGSRLHARRIQTMIQLAHGIVANSAATLSALTPMLAGAGRSPHLSVAHLGTTKLDLDGYAPSNDRGRPFFVTIGTIEPRKNHLLLLNLWRQMAEHLGPENCPKLVIIGRRGWENEQVVDMLERCPSLTRCVEELGSVSDRMSHHLLRGARALLLPSFAEGYGMPVAEALAMRIPVICSDLPALREAGSGIPDYLDPLDGPGWRAAIEDYSLPGSSRRADQLAALQGWRAPEWHDHLSTVLSLVATVANAG